MIIIVSYTLSGPSSNYTQLYEVLKAQPKWSHYMDSTWIIQTSQTPDQISEKIKPFMQPQDRVFVARLSTANRANGWMPKDAWDWINKAYGSEP